MEDKRELVVFDSCGKYIDAEFIKGTLDSCGIKTSIIGDQIGNELGASFVKVVILRDDLEKAIKEIFSSEKLNESDSKKENKMSEKLDEISYIFESKISNNLSSDIISEKLSYKNLEITNQLSTNTNIIISDF